MRLIALVFLALPAALGACASDGSKKQASRGDDAPVFRGSACESCLTGACGAELDACSGDPECGRYWNCLGNCELNELGGPEASCEARCLTAVGLAEDSTRLETSTCLWQGAGSACAECGAIATPDVSRITDQTCPASTQTDGCMRCEDENCCHTHDACRANPECDPIRTCLLDCPSQGPECQASCAAEHPDGRADFGARLACVYVHCSAADQCGPFNQCTSCVLSGCRELYVACQADAECYSLSACVTACGDDGACVSDCHRAFPSASDRFDEYAVCAVHRCGDACG